MFVVVQECWGFFKEGGFCIRLIVVSLYGSSTFESNEFNKSKSNSKFQCTNISININLNINVYLHLPFALNSKKKSLKYFQTLILFFPENL